jgi:hypothetical protein
LLGIMRQPQQLRIGPGGRGEKYINEINRTA